MLPFTVTAALAVAAVTSRSASAPTHVSQTRVPLMGRHPTPKCHSETPVFLDGLELRGRRELHQLDQVPGRIARERARRAPVLGVVLDRMARLAQAILGRRVPIAER